MKKCDFVCENQYKLTRHNLNTKHKKTLGRSRTYQLEKTITDKLKMKLSKKVCPEKVFGEDEVKQLVEDCDGSIREILRVVKWMRHCFGKKKVYSP